MSFSNRWRIQGYLTTDSNLHIGSGVDFERDDILTENGEKIHVSLVAVGFDGRPLIPGATLKGNLRNYLESRLPQSSIEQSFGSLIAGDDNSVGGKFEFCDALFESVDCSTKKPSHWEDSRKTGVAVNVSIDRDKGVAANKKLFHWEVVPAKTKFKAEIYGQDLNDDEVKLLLQALNGFNDNENPIQMGAGSADNWGKFIWETCSVREVSKGRIAEWLQTGRTLPVGDNMFAEASLYLDRTDLKNNIERLNAENSLVEIKLNIEFDGGFLVNDPSRTKSKRDNDENGDKPNHIPLLDLDGKVILPASAFRGAFRAQAEKILRTLNKKVCNGDDNDDKPDNVQSICEVVSSCPACQLFGCTGWRSPVIISDFVNQNNSHPKRQEFVAIDRFTGGGADGAKFNAERALSPVFSGSIKLDLGRLEKAGVGEWSIGLLAHTIRDLIEGDITFGFGASKGYGAVKTCKITEIKMPPYENIPSGFKQTFTGEVYQTIKPDMQMDDFLAAIRPFLTKLEELGGHDD